MPPPNDASKYACAYPRGRPRTRRSTRTCRPNAPAAFAFLSAMSYTNDDQNSIALDINNGMTPEEAAQKWIDANPDVWQPWVDAGLAAQG